MKPINFIVLLFLFSFTQSNAQNPLNSFLKKKTNQIIQGGNDLINGKREKSSLKKKDLFQNKTIAAKDENSTRVAIAENLLIDIEGKYPGGYSPKWKYITYEAWIDTPYEDWINPSANLKTQRGKFAIGDYQGKAVLMFGSSNTCDCYADIEIKDNALITSVPQTFKVSNFTKIQNLRRVNEKCSGNSNQEGGWEGQVTLSANKDGDIAMNLVIESYKSDLGKGLGVSYRFIINNYKIENEMSAFKANKIIADEIAAKKARKDYLEKSEKQIQALLKTIRKKYPNECKSCFSRNQGYGIDTETTHYVYSNGDDAGSSTDYNPTTSVEIGNNCNYRIKIIGIQQKYSEEKGYYYEEVMRTYEANEKHKNKQGVFSYLFTSLVGLNDDFTVQDNYCIDCFSVNSIQWLRVTK